MTSWGSIRTNPLKQKEPTIRSYYSSESDYATSTLQMLYSFVYCQRVAEPFYIHDKKGYFQPLLQVSPILHYVKESPPGATNFADDVNQLAPVLNQLSFNTLKRTIQSLFLYNNETKARIDTFLSNFGLVKQTFDVGIVLDISGCVAQVIPLLKQFQKRTGKKTLRVFVMTDTMNLLQEFAQKGDPSWSYVSMMRFNTPQDDTYKLLKTLSEFHLMKQIEFVAVKLGSSVGKLLYLSSEKVVNESQILAIDGVSWKVL